MKDTTAFPQHRLNGSYAAPQEETKTPENGLGSLLGGIISDLQKLVENHLKLLRIEVVDDFHKRIMAFMLLGAGGGLLVFAMAFGLVGLIGWLAWLVPAVPWFAWTGIVTLILLAAGISLWVIGQQKLEKVNALPEKTLKTVKESVQWISDQVKTG